MKTQMDLESYKRLSFARRGRILTIALNRPERLNAVDGVMHEELSRVFFDAARDECSDIIVLTGATRAFCSVGGVGWRAGLIDQPAECHKPGRDALSLSLSI